MNIYKVTIGSSAGVIHDVFFVRAKTCAQAEKKVLGKIGDEYADDSHVVKVEEMSGEFIE